MLNFNNGPYPDFHALAALVCVIYYISKFSISLPVFSGDAKYPLPVKAEKKSNKGSKGIKGHTPPATSSLAKLPPSLSLTDPSTPVRHLLEALVKGSVKTETDAELAFSVCQTLIAKLGQYRADKSMDSKRTMEEWDEVFDHLNCVNTISKAAEKRSDSPIESPKVAQKRSHSPIESPKAPKIIKEEPANDYDHQEAQMDHVHQPQQRHSNHQRHQNYQDHQDYNDPQVHQNYQNHNVPNERQQNWQFEESHDEPMFQRRPPNGPMHQQNRPQRTFFNGQNRPQPLMSLDFPKRK